MIQSLQQIKRRIRSIENTEKLTHAMEVISISKLRAAEERLLRAREYFSRLDKTLNNVLESFGASGHPLLEAREAKGKTTLCLITSDTGLCGSYNHNILREAQDFISGHAAGGIDLVAVGKRAVGYCKRRGIPVSGSYTELNGRYSREVSDKIAADLMDRFSSGKAAEVYVAYTRFESASRLKPVVEKFLNIAPKEPAKGKEMPCLVEPDIKSVLEYLLPAYLLNKMRFMILNSFASEHAARSMAMGEATNNADEMLETLTLLRNKVRQANITREIIEVISAADALKG